MKWMTGCCLGLGLFGFVMLPPQDPGRRQPNPPSRREPPARSAPAPSGKWVSGFYVGYQASSYPPSAIDFESLTHVMVFAVLPRANGTLDTTLFVDAVNGPKLAQEVARRAHDARRVPILTIGGSDTETGFKGATRPENIAAFVRNIVTVLQDWGFDGVDIDWEPLAESDYASLISLIEKLRAARPGIVITADISWQNRNFPLSNGDAAFYSALARNVDQMNMMTYGMADNWGGWAVWHSSAVTGDGPDHPSSVQGSARTYTDVGVPAAKLGMGIGFYGSCWSSPARQPLQLPGNAQVVASDNDMSFAAIKNTYFRAANYHYDNGAEAPYLSFSTPTGPNRCTFVSYEDETSVAAKGRLAQEAGLGGTIIWQLNEGYNPSAPDPSALLHAVGTAFGVTTPR
jgi:chitinase